MPVEILTWNQDVAVSVTLNASRFGEELALTLRDMIKESMGTSGFPKIKTGKLKSSIIAGKIDKFTFTVSSDMEYAPYVEFGTSKAPPYPYFRPNIERLKAAAKGAIV